MNGEPALLDPWCQLASDVEWLCHVGVGYFFAPWHEPTRREYLLFRETLARTVALLADRGVIRAERVTLIRAAIAAHGAPHAHNATMHDLRRRDQLLRRATEAPEALRAAVRESIPAGRWPLPQFIPAPAEARRRAR